MSGFLKKWAMGHKTAWIAIAVAYLLVIIATPLNHTCELGEACSKHSHLGNSGHPCSGEFCTNLRFDVALKQNNCASKALSNQDLCMACLYSIVSKSTQINTGAALVNIDASVKESKKVIGGQIVSDDPSPIKHIDVIALAIRNEMTALDLTTIRCAGQPELSPDPGMEPISLAAEEVFAKLY